MKENFLRAVVLRERYEALKLVRANAALADASVAEQSLAGCRVSNQWAYALAAAVWPAWGAERQLLARRRTS